MMIHSKCVLVAEDNPALANVTRFNLERAGFHVHLARDGEEAAGLIAGHHFDLVITDLQMPHMDGEQLCQYIRTVAMLPDLPIIICSAKGLEIDASRLVEEYGLSHVLFKPFSPMELVRVATSLLEVRYSILDA